MVVYCTQVEERVKLTNKAPPSFPLKITGKLPSVITFEKLKLYE